jgi:hypothetical protein
VREGGGALGLASEALDELVVVGVALAHDLEGDVPIQNVVVGEIDLGHTSCPQRLDDAVAVVYKKLLHSSALYP